MQRQKVKIHITTVHESWTLFNPKGGGGGPKVPAGQEIVCYFSQDHAMVTKNLDFIHKHPN